MITYLQSATRSSKMRCEFIASVHFVVPLAGYFPVALLLNRCLGLPDDYLVLGAQLIGVAVLFLLSYSSRAMISKVLAASLRFSVVLITTVVLVPEKFADFVPEVLTPPPNL